MAHASTIVGQILKLVPRHVFQQLAEKHHAGQKLRKATRWDQFAALLVSQFTGVQSLRDIETSQRSMRSSLYHLGCKVIPRSSLARLNEMQPASLYEQLFFKLVQRCQTHRPAHAFRFKSPLYSLDSTLIDLSLKLFPWSDFNKRRGAVKLHVGLDHRGHLPTFAAITESKVSDLQQARILQLPRNSIVVCDKGYTDYGWFKSLTDKGIFFVTRERKNARYRVVERRKVVQKGGIISDQVIELTGKRTKQMHCPLLRRVTCTDAVTGKQYVFLSNRFDLAASTIAAIYKDRWQIELFFKAIKQNLKIHAFVGNSINAVMTQIWIALCAYLLVCYLKFSCRLSWSVQKIIRLLQGKVFTKMPLSELLQGAPPPGPSLQPQLGLQL